MNGGSRLPRGRSAPGGLPFEGGVSVPPPPDDDKSKQPRRKPLRLGQYAVLGGAPRLLAAIAIFLAASAAAFAVGSRLGARYADVAAQLHVDAQLAKLHQLATRRLSAGSGADAQAGLQLDEAGEEALPGTAAGGTRAGEPTLSFQVCNGFANQRVAVLSGVLIAAQLNRTVVLPRLLLNGTQPTAAEVNERVTGSVPFGNMFDVKLFADRMAARGVRTSAYPPDPAAVVAVRMGSYRDILGVLTTTYSAQQHIRLDCPMFRVTAEAITANSQLVFATLDAMQPSARLMAALQKIEGKLRGMTPTKAYNVLHLRVEDDWVSHCKRWEHVGDGIVRNNCLNNTVTVGEQLRAHGVNPQVPLLVATSWLQAHKELLTAALGSLRANNYNVLLRHTLLGEEELPQLSREESALIDFYLGLNAQQFIGNSVSTFSAMLIMERWNAGRYATYYNGGNIPLEVFLPLYRMPWVFTYNDWSGGTEYDMMVKAAIRSAINIARMKPFCMYSGSLTSPIYTWLVDAGVTIIQHTPIWKDAFAKEVARNREHNAKVHSHLYATDGRMVGTFQRIDIPILHEFDQYHYVLFTDCDVFFRKQMKLVDWGTPLPVAAGMGYEMDDLFPYNAGIMLMNVPYLRKTNAAFVEWILKQRNGLYFDGYGPLDQGAYNQYYEREIKGRPISKDFNAKPYQELRQEARIVHWHGPKPNHYLDWLLKGQCKFGGICEAGYIHSFCHYVADYSQFAPEWDVAATLRTLCVDGQGLVQARVQWAAMKHLEQTRSS
ncbi:Glycosyl transferase family 8 [Micractinium conductrix]|uniref:O-fucosyltransferase family protein n=1 Tax=Micractinium conductrix TaxID=554055 RepID=A0A2P6V907_9CHLO|nr:Glycosyl transferase family 8 [Micractinium conductrix]|eukprot:PSC70561.1 Glycosyl transferase family 8 [Micractinium conductrix]